MTKVSHVVLILGTALLSLTACGTSPSGQSGKEGQVGQELSPAGALFINRSGTSGLEEVTFARLAETRTTNSAVRGFAASMIADLAPVNQQLAALTQINKITPPSEMDERHAMLLQQLQTLNGPAFDRAYLDGQLQELTMLIQAFQKEADSGTDPRVRSFAQQNLPMLLQHLQKASTIVGL
jgi:putative membrane protein